MSRHPECGTCRCRPPLPPLNCSGCEGSEEEVGWMIEVRVITQPGEEGYSEVVMYLCEDCDTQVIDGLKALGFVNHTHGGTAFLQDDTCPGGYANCTDPVANEYGPYVIGNPEYSKMEMGIDY